MVQLGFIQDTDDDIFNGQGIDSIDEWLNMDDEYVKTFPRNVRKPGGGGQGEIIRLKAEMNLQLTVFFIFHKKHTILSVDYSDITVPKLCALHKHQDMESDK